MSKPQRLLAMAMFIVGTIYNANAALSQYQTHYELDAILF